MRRGSHDTDTCRRKTLWGGRKRTVCSPGRAAWEGARPDRIWTSDVPSADLWAKGLLLSEAPSLCALLQQPQPTQPGYMTKFWTQGRSAVLTDPGHPNGQEGISSEIKHISHNVLIKMSFLALLFDTFQNLKINPLSFSVFILSSCTFSFYWFIFPRIELLRHNWFSKALLIANSNNCKSLNLFMQSVGKWNWFFIRTSFLKISDTYIGRFMNLRWNTGKQLKPVSNQHISCSLLVLLFAFHNKSTLKLINNLLWSKIKQISLPTCSRKCWAYSHGWDSGPWNSLNVTWKSFGVDLEDLASYFDS